MCCRCWGVLRRYPAITPDWHFDNRQVDLIGQGFDAAIGGGFELPLGVVARKLTPAHRVLVAAPAYLQRHPPIEHPSALRSMRHPDPFAADRPRALLAADQPLAGAAAAAIAQA
jgi:DNA-binding transcriptional LysR family regulator